MDQQSSMEGEVGFGFLARSNFGWWLQATGEGL
jgi:hypothetical protein